MQKKTTKVKEWNLTLSEEQTVFLKMYTGYRSEKGGKL